MQNDTLHSTAVPKYTKILIMCRKYMFLHNMEDNEILLTFDCHKLQPMKYNVKLFVFWAYIVSM